MTLIFLTSELPETSSMTPVDSFMDIATLFADSPGPSYVLPKLAARATSRVLPPPVTTVTSRASFIRSKVFSLS